MNDGALCPLDTQETPFSDVNILLLFECELPNIINVGPFHFCFILILIFLVDTRVFWASNYEIFVGNWGFPPIFSTVFLLDIFFGVLKKI